MPWHIKGVHHWLYFFRPTRMHHAHEWDNLSPLSLLSIPRIRLGINFITLSSSVQTLAGTHWWNSRNVEIAVHTWVNAFTPYWSYNTVHSVTTVNSRWFYGGLYHGCLIQSTLATSTKCRRYGGCGGTTSWHHQIRSKLARTEIRTQLMHLHTNTCMPTFLHRDTLTHHKWTQQNKVKKMTFLQSVRK